jgi:aryl-alcohol dehydrogenase-like predicted oxidoreductase
MLLSRLALGTAQFGSPYGVANQRGQINLIQGAAILSYALDAGLDTLDTAMAYGNSEERLGQIGVASWKVVTKLPALPEQCPSVPTWVEDAVAVSLRRLQVDSLYGLLLHYPTDLLGSQGYSLYTALQNLKAQGWVKKVGISIYDPEEIAIIYTDFPVDLVQAPFNILDQRLVTSGWLSRLRQDGVEVHSRSLFLQGLLLMNPKTRPAKFGRWRSLWQSWDDWLAENQVTPLQACLGSAWHQPDIDRILVGVDSLRQLQETLGVIAGKLPCWPDHIFTDDLDLINPVRWAAL